MTVVARRGDPATPTAAIAVPDFLWPELRSDHAGAVMIYRGILAVSLDAELRQFANEHLATQRQHLRLMEGLVPPERRSRLLGVWRLAGWLTGALPALFGPRAVFRTIEAVETFVDQHYAVQTATLTDQDAYRALHDLLEQCRLDEVEHRDDAQRRLGPPSAIGRTWAGIVGHGSRVGVVLAARFSAEQAKLRIRAV